MASSARMLFMPLLLILLVQVASLNAGQHHRSWYDPLNHLLLHWFRWLLLLSGDVESNPGPVRYPCTVCSKPVRSNQRGIECSMCGKWTHAKCCGVSPEEYLRLGECEDELWYCPSCWASELPFFNCSAMSGTAGAPFGTLNDTLGEPEEAGSGESFGGGGVSGHLVVCHLNIRSLVSKLEELQIFLEKHSVARDGSE